MNSIYIYVVSIMCVYVCKYIPLWGWTPEKRINDLNLVDHERWTYRSNRSTRLPPNPPRLPLLTIHHQFNIAIENPMIVDFP